jgi:hypothetical protein
MLVDLIVITIIAVLLHFGGIHAPSFEFFAIISLYILGRRLLS